jgi:L-asparaginase/Glu-tRNA(Gln) amidotransferase subunit D
MNSHNLPYESDIVLVEAQLRSAHPLSKSPANMAQAYRQNKK